MKAGGNLWEEKEKKTYITQINWDWLFFKGQMIIGGVLLGAILLYFILFS